jgi:hypothetical protein
MRGDWWLSKATSTEQHVCDETGFLWSASILMLPNRKSLLTS